MEWPDGDTPDGYSETATYCLDDGYCIDHWPSSVEEQNGLHFCPTEITITNEITLHEDTPYASGVTFTYSEPINGVNSGPGMIPACNYNSDAVGFGMSSEQENSKHIPVLQFKDTNDKLPCDDSYLSVFDTKEKNFKKTSFHFPLESESMPIMAPMGTNHILIFRNQVDYGIDFTGDKENISYDKYLNYSYDGAKNSIRNTNIINFSEDFKIENQLSIPSRTFTAYESVVTTDNGIVYLNGDEVYNGAIGGSGIGDTINMIGAYVSYSHYWNGKIANMSYYNKALTASEVLQNYNSQKARFGL